MKIIVIGATGTIGLAVADTLAAQGHNVVRASRRSGVKVNIDEPASIAALYRTVTDVDAVVCCAGNGIFRALSDLTDDDLAAAIRSKLLGQVNVIRQGLAHVRDNGSITITTGVLSRQPMPGGAALSLVNGGLESFVMSAAFEAPRGIRVNAVRPPWVRETLVALSMDPSIGLPAETVAKAYAASVAGGYNGEAIDPKAFAR